MGGRIAGMADEARRRGLASPMIIYDNQDYQDGDQKGSIQKSRESQNPVNPDSDKCEGLGIADDRAF